MKKKKNRGKSTVLTGYSCTRLRSSAHQQLWKKFAAQSKRCRVQIRVASWQRRVGIIPRLVVVVLHVQVLHLAVVDAQRATGIIYVLTFQRLEQRNETNMRKTSIGDITRQMNNVTLLRYIHFSFYTYSYIISRKINARRLINFKDTFVSIIGAHHTTPHGVIV